MPPKGSKKGTACKRRANLRKQAVSNQHKEVKKSVKKEPAPTHDANGLLIGSKEANWALLKASGKWYTYLDEQDRGEAEDKGVELGSEEWVKMKTPQLTPPVLEETRLLSEVEWDFPTPQLSSSPPRRNKRKATDDDDDVDPPATKRSRRGPVTTSGEGDTPQDILDLLALPPARHGQRMAFGMGLPVLDTLPPRQCNKAATSAPTTTIEEPSSSASITLPIAGESSASAAEAPPIVVEAPEVVGEKEPSPPPSTIAISTTSSTLSSLGSRTPSPPPDLPPSSLLSPVKEEEDVAEDEEVETPRKLSTTTLLPPSSPAVGTLTSPGRKGARGSFPCTKCTKSFGRVEHLNRHVLSVHDKVKKFVCGGCGGRFSRKDNMRQHQGKCGLWVGLGEEGEG
ncbi:cutinase G-box binding protein [Venturia nashicola]|uniref:Cutinase G-box binding protein n=1 Tax=Venturia nashicola TaxID=86259 RepID=A0A4Z1NGH1_9PEZI|nr:cutinase G-box binding protein [Venturia nashicola]